MKKKQRTASNTKQNQNQQPLEIRVQIFDRDLVFLSDCDDMVRELLERAKDVEVTFFPHDLPWVRKTLSPERNGWGMIRSGKSDVAIAEQCDKGALKLTLTHERWLGKSVDQPKEEAKVA